MAAAPKLRVIGRHGVGTDNIDLEAARRRGIRVTNGPESNAGSVAEHTVALILALAHRIPMLDREVREDNWQIRNTYLQMMDLKGKTLGLVGFGHIAQLVAKKLALGFEMNVITWGSRHPETYPDYVKQADSLEDLFRRADVVSLHCPLRPETNNLVSTELLNIMKPTAFLINTARGEIVDIPALCDALEAGKLAGFGVDTMSPEGVKPCDRLLAHPRTVFTPHCAAHTIDGMNNMALHAAIGVDEVLTGKEPTWPVV